MKKLLFLLSLVFLFVSCDFYIQDYKAPQERFIVTYESSGNIGDDKYHFYRIENDLGNGGIPDIRYCTTEKFEVGDRLIFVKEKDYLEFQKWKNNGKNNILEKR